MQLSIMNALLTKEMKRQGAPECLGLAGFSLNHDGGFRADLVAGVIITDKGEDHGCCFAIPILVQANTLEEAVDEIRIVVAYGLGRFSYVQQIAAQGYFAPPNIPPDEPVLLHFENVTFCRWPSPQMDKAGPSYWLNAGDNKRP